MYKIIYGYIGDSSTKYFGNPVVPYQNGVGSHFNLLTGMPFLHDATVVGWAYYMTSGK